MNMCRHHGILLWGVKREQAVEFCVCVKDFKKMKPIVYKTKLHPQIKKKKGFPFYIGRMKKNWTFFFGLSALFLPFAFFVYLCLANSVSGTGYLYERNTIKNRKFSTGIPRNETAQPAL